MKSKVWIEISLSMLASLVSSSGGEPSKPGDARVAGRGQKFDLCLNEVPSFERSIPCTNTKRDFNKNRV